MEGINLFTEKIWMNTKVHYKSSKQDIMLVSGSISSTASTRKQMASANTSWKIKLIMNIGTYKISAFAMHGLNSKFLISFHSITCKIFIFRWKYNSSSFQIPTQSIFSNDIRMKIMFYNKQDKSWLGKGMKRFERRFMSRHNNFAKYFYYFVESHISIPIPTKV